MDTIITKLIYSQDVDGARGEIFDYILRYRDKKVIYISDWNGFGAVPVLRSVAQELGQIKDKKTPAELCFDRIIYIDCSAWESRRAMQRKIAEELELDFETMAMFDKQDEEDDFSGKDHGSRDVVRSVSAVIDQAVGQTKFMMIFLNGSDEEVDISRFGINPEYRDHRILWTFKRRSFTMHNRHRKIARQLGYTHIYLDPFWEIHYLHSSLKFALLRQEASNILARHPGMPSIDQTMVTYCCMYELFLQRSFHSATGFDWAAHAPNYWMCDGIIKGNRAREISSTLHQEIHWEIDDASLLYGVFKNLMKEPEAPFFIVEKDKPLLIKRPYPWISITSKNLIIHEDTDKALLAKVSSLFVALEKSDHPQSFPNGFFKHCINIGVLVLSRCAFSFVSPPFHWCHGLRFLGLDHCTHENTSEGENNASWTWLQNLWVFDLRYTEWDDILSEEKMHNMGKLRELNIEGFLCWQLAARLHGKLPYLRRLRIMKPMHRADTSIDNSSSLVLDKIELEVLDLSGNRDMKNLSISSAMARSLQMLILDGCDGLENVVVPDGLPSSLRSFSFDGYGPATQWTSSIYLPPKRSERKHDSDADTSAVKTSKISLQGCTQLENLFLRGLPNLEELDLSGSAIKVLDFETMVIDVPRLKRLILLGCEHLRAIKGAILYGFGLMKQLELVCVDTRPWMAHGSTRPCLAKHKYLQLHATLADARLARSLYRLIDHYSYQRNYEGVSFNIHVTSSSAYGGGVQVQTTRDVMIEPSSQQHQFQVTMYIDAFFKIGAAPMLLFPQPPTQPLDRHIEISDGSRGLEVELEERHDYDDYSTPDDASLAKLMTSRAFSLHVHDASTSASMAAGRWARLRWCRIERCPNLDMVFPNEAWGDENNLQTIWASHLLMAHCIWSKGLRDPHDSFGSLRHLHLSSCPRLQYVLPVWVTSFPSLETLHIIHCGDLTHVFPLDNEFLGEIAVQGLPFPKLTTIHLHDLPKLQQICEVKMLAPALETIRIRGCFGLRRLPTVAAREPGVKKPTVKIEKDVWDSLEWDGLDADHHPDLFEPPVHSRYYRRSCLLRGTVLR